MENMSIKEAIEYCIKDKYGSISVPNKKLYDKIGLYLKQLGYEWIDDYVHKNGFFIFKDRTMISIDKDKKLVHFGDISNYGSFSSVMISINYEDFVIIDGKYYNTKEEAIEAINSVFN